MFATITCGPYALYVCLICTPYMHALYACLICTPYVVVSLSVSASSSRVLGECWRALAPERASDNLRARKLFIRVLRGADNSWAVQPV